MSRLHQTAGLLGARLLDPRSEDAQEPGRRRAAVAVVLREVEDEQIEVLLIQRAVNPRDYWSGHIAFPGGRWDEADGSLVATALRETFEEVGVAISHEDVIGRLPQLSPRSERLPKIDITPFVALVRGDVTVTANYEVAETFWVALEELRRIGPSATYHFELEGFRREWPAYPFRGHLIWGLTERILTDFLALIPTN